MGTKKARFKIECSPELIADIQAYGNEVAKQIAIKARETLTEEYANAVYEYFYDRYEPVEYIRKWTLEKSYEKFYRNSHGNIFYGGVKVTPRKMPDVHNEDNSIVLFGDEDSVRTGGAFYGWHGCVYYQGTPTIATHMYALRDSIIAFRYLWCQDCIKRAKTTRQYSYLFK